MKCNAPDCIGETFGRDCQCYKRIENIGDHMALLCECGHVKFNLLRTCKIECARCSKVLKDTIWSCNNSKPIAFSAEG